MSLNASTKSRVIWHSTPYSLTVYFFCSQYTWRLIGNWKEIRGTCISSSKRRSWGPSSDIYPRQSDPLSSIPSWRSFWMSISFLCTLFSQISQVYLRYSWLRRTISRLWIHLHRSRMDDILNIAGILVAYILVRYSFFWIIYDKCKTLNESRNEEPQDLAPPETEMTSTSAWMPLKEWQIDLILQWNIPVRFHTRYTMDSREVWRVAYYFRA